MIDPRVQSLADRYGDRSSASDVRLRIHSLYESQVRWAEQSILNAAMDAASLSALLADEVDYSKLTPQMKEALELADLNLQNIADYSPEQIKGFEAAWKGKYFELLVRDRLNEGEWVGDIHLSPGQVAKLAESPSQTGWDLQILNADGEVDGYLQLKATDSLAYVRKALERYPDIQIVGTDEVANLSDQIIRSGMSEQELEQAISLPMEPLLESALENAAETVLASLPFVVIALAEGHKVMTGNKSFKLALEDGAKRAAKTTSAITVGAIVYAVEPNLLLAAAASASARLAIDITLKRDKRLGRAEECCRRRLRDTQHLARIYA